MKKKILIFISMIITVYLVGCRHQHDYADATCTEAKTCTICRDTEGEALGHNWIDADCNNPKTCKVCEETEGEALGHDWIDADCNNPKTCIVCGETEGEALGHLVEIGLCSQCNELQNETQLQAIISYFYDCITSAQLAGDTMLSANTSSTSDIYRKILVAQAYFNTVKENLQGMYEICKNYSELKDITNGVKLLLGLIPDPIKSSDANLLINWVKSYNSFFGQSKQFFSDVISKWLNQNKLITE